MRGKSVEETFVDARAEKAARRPRGTIGAHLVALVAIQLVLLIGLIGFSAIQDFRIERREARERTASIAKIAVSKVSTQLQANSAELTTLPQYKDLFKSPDVCTMMATESTTQSGDYKQRFLILRSDGSPLCPSSKGQLGFGGAAWVKRAVGSAPTAITAGPLLDPNTHSYSIIFAVGFKELGLVVGFATDLASVAPALNKQIEGTPAAAYRLETGDGKLQLAMSKGFNGVDRIASVAVVPKFGWKLTAGFATKDALSVANRALRERIAFAVFMVLIVLAVAIIIQRRFVRPIRSLANATKRITEGDLRATVDPSGPVELVALGEGFNAMAEVRARAEAALRTAFKAERRASDELREVDEMRQAFLMAISHELRTPLTSVTGYATFLQEEADTMSPDDIRMSINAIASQSKRLERLLTDLLDVERLARGVVEPKLHETDVKALVLNVVDRLSSPTRDIKTTFTGPEKSIVDPALLERILENLVMNAIKHTPEGSRIWVRARRSNGHLSLKVDDAGAGVPDELKTRIFEAFEQGDVPGHAPGTGVGLALVSQFAKLHGGKAWVEDRRGGGASFRVEVPAKKPSASRKARTTTNVA